MTTLEQYVRDHTRRGECNCGRCADRGTAPDPTDARGAWHKHTANTEFFTVALTGSPTREELRALVEEHRGVFAEVAPFDGKEHSFIELGAWLGDQGIALQFMALATMLGMTRLRTPSSLIPGLPEQMRQELAGAGLVTIQAEESYVGQNEASKHS